MSNSFYLKFDIAAIVEATVTKQNRPRAMQTKLSPLQRLNKPMTLRIFDQLDFGSTTTLLFIKVSSAAKPQDSNHC